ncbi:nucleotide pyrophosphohydrolase [Ochrobactrum sp. GRS2]|nr:nucleotide pyrophosphohydrolase [Ochrobactrum sp. GRS2]
MTKLIVKLKKFVDDREWDQFHNPKDLSISISIEVNELLEIFQWKSENTPINQNDIEKIKNEVADIYIYLLLLCEKLNIDLEKETANKISRNEKRFPIEKSLGIAKTTDMDK